MKKRMLISIMIAILSYVFLPIPTYAFGGYFIVKGESEYHNVLCENINGYYIEDITWYKTLDEVMKTKFSPAPCCSENGFDYEDDNSSTWNSKNSKTDNILEIERFIGVVDGYTSAQSESYETAYNEGIEKGYNDGLIDGYDEGYEKGNNTGYNNGVKDGIEQQKENSETSWIVYLVCAVILYWTFKFGHYFGEETSSKRIGELHTENIKLRQSLNNQEDILHVLNLAAKRSNTSVSDIVDELYINYHISTGYSESDARTLLNIRKQEYKNQK